MSRSVHTRPRRIRAAARTLRPREPRAAADRNRRWATAGALKHGGLIASIAQPRSAPAVARLPRIIIRLPRPGYTHPAGAAGIRRLLAELGASYWYGLRSIELRPGATSPPHRGPVCGRLAGPGRIILYDQPPSPWLLAGRLRTTECDRLRRAGALVEPDGIPGWTRVTWPDGALRRFMLDDVLLHELGHHVVQHETRRPGRVRRTRDHESAAIRVAERFRRLLAVRSAP